MNTFVLISTSLALTAHGSLALAAEPDPQQQETIEKADRTGTLPPSESDDDLAPPVPSPTFSSSGLVEQAGVGGVVSYARAGVLELGGSASVNAASGYFRFALQPSIGYFILDNIQLSAIVGLSYVSVDVPNGDGTSTSADQTLFSVLVEPSAHVPFSKTLFGFLGVGLGLSYSDQSGAGFAIQPRLGLNVLVGRSGILSPAIFAQYTTTSAIQTDAGTLLQVSFGYGLNLGYTVMW